MCVAQIDEEVLRPAEGREIQQWLKVLAITCVVLQCFAALVFIYYFTGW